jgi:hypothetical protein
MYIKPYFKLERSLSRAPYISHSEADISVLLAGEIEEGEEELVHFKQQIAYAQWRYAKTTQSTSHLTNQIQVNQDNATVNQAIGRETTVRYYCCS